MGCILAAVQHDPDGRLYNQTERILPMLGRIFSGIAVRATDTTEERGLELLARAGVLVQREPRGGHLLLGRARRGALALGLELEGSHLLFCDFDRVLHWAEFYPSELEQIAGELARADFTVLGRTERAFASHPRVQRDTEAIINHVYSVVSGKPWDVTAASRGLSRRAAAEILAGCPEEGIGTDLAWPLFVQRSSELTLGYYETEGLEFETADRFEDEVAAAGGLQAWIEQIDSDPRAWMMRLEIARAEVEGVLPYHEGHEDHE